MRVKQNGRVLRAIQWNAAEREPNLTAKKDGVEIAYTIEENEYQGTKYVELTARRLPLVTSAAPLAAGVDSYATRAGEQCVSATHRVR